MRKDEATGVLHLALVGSAHADETHSGHRSFWCDTGKKNQREVCAQVGINDLHSWRNKPTHD